jgi:hypothetical protein
MKQPDSRCNLIVSSQIKAIVEKWNLAENTELLRWQQWVLQIKQDFRQPDSWSIVHKLTSLPWVVNALALDVITN